MPDIAIGRKEIMAVLHVGSWRTVQMWKKTDPGFLKIIRTAPNNRPFIVVKEAMDWFIEYDKIIRQKNQPTM